MTEAQRDGSRDAWVHEQQVRQLAEKLYVGVVNSTAAEAFGMAESFVRLAQDRLERLRVVEKVEE